MIEPIELEQLVNARPETVFTYFTDADKYRRWQGVEAELDPVPGGVYRVRYFGQAGVVGRYLEVDPPRRLVFTWGWAGTSSVAPAGISAMAPGSTVVEVTLTPQGHGTLVRLRHRDLPTEESKQIHGAYWPIYLGRLAEAAEGRETGPDPVEGALAAARDA